MGLDVKLNPIYAGRKQDWKQSRFREINNAYYDLSGWAWDEPAAWDAYQRYIKFIAQHFKGRVAHYSIGADWPGNPTVSKMLKETVKSIDPNVTMDDQWSPGYPGARVDAGGDFDELHQLFAKAGQAIKAKRAHGYNGLVNTSIMTWSLYPPGPAAPGKPAWLGVKDENGFVDYRYWCETEMARAKFVAQAFVGSAGLGMVTMFCNPYFSASSVGQSLFRVPVPDQIVTPMQPDAGYYVLRTISTVLDDWKPAEYSVTFSSPARFDWFTFHRGGNESMVAAWIPGKASDNVREMSSDVTFLNLKARKAWVIDLINGAEQELNFSINGANTVAKEVLIKDYPTLMRLEQ